MPPLECVDVRLLEEYELRLDSSVCRIKFCRSKSASSFDILRGPSIALREIREIVRSRSDDAVILGRCGVW